MNQINNQTIKNNNYDTVYEDCWDCFVEGYGLVELSEWDFSSIYDQCFESTIDGLWWVRFTLPEDLFESTTLNLTIETIGFLGDTHGDTLTGRTLVLGPNCTRKLQEFVGGNLWGSICYSVD